MSHEISKHSHIRVLFICKRRQVYCDNISLTTGSGLYNSANMVVQTLAEYGITSKLVDVIDANDIDREVHKFNPTHIFVEAFWVTPEKMLELLKLHRHRKWIVRNHSKTPFLASEGIGIPWMLEYIKLGRDWPITVAPNSKGVVQEIEDAFNIHLPYLPNIYKNNYHGHSEHEHKSIINIGCFGAIRLLKNQAVQALASVAYARLSQRTVHFHINATRQEQLGSSVLKGIRAIFEATHHAKLIEHDWLCREDFLNLIGTMDINLQVSYTETFNIVLADAVSQKSPVLGSADIPWLPLEFQADPNDTRSIIDGIAYVLERNRHDMYRKNITALDKSATEATERWLKFLYR